MLLCDTLHLVGFRIFNRKLVEDDKKKENKHRLLGFEAIKRTQSKESKETDDGDVKGLKLSDKPISSGSPLKSKHQLGMELSSPDKSKNNKEK